MQSKNHRLHLRKERDFFLHSSKVFTPSLQWFVGSNTQSTYTVACIVPKAVLKHAVDRNRVKRRIYQYLLNISQDLLPRKSLVILVRNRHVTDQSLYESVSILNNRPRPAVSAL